MDLRGHEGKAGVGARRSTTQRQALRTAMHAGMSQMAGSDL